MFTHITVLLSFIFAIALTHVFSSASELILARDRVRFSGLHAVTMLNSVLTLIVNWLDLWQLEGLKHWSVGEVLLQLGWAIPQYFTCSLVSVSVPEHGAVDMAGFYIRQRRAIYSAYIALMVMAALENYFDRNLTAGRANDWIREDLLILTRFICALLAGWTKPRWTQWFGICGILLENSWFLLHYAILP